MTDPLPIVPLTRPVNATVALPGSKSITNRALILAALCDREITLTGALFSRDTRIMVAALRELGFSVAADESARTLTIAGLGGKIPRAAASLFVGNAGTAARFLTALLALHPQGEYTLDGDPAMRARPMGGLLRALSAQGATFTDPASNKKTDRFPFILRTAGLRGGNIPVDAAASSQILSALLMVAPYAQTPATVQLAGETVSEPFVEMTLRLCAAFGQPAQKTTANAFSFSQGKYHWPEPVCAIEPDATAASYFLALPLAAPAQIHIRGLSSASLQGDVAFAEILQSLGLPLAATEAGWTVSSAEEKLPGGDFDFNAISDTFLTLAALAPLLSSPLTIRGIAHARKQETDRLLAMATELVKLGQRVEPSPETLRADPSIGHFTIFPDRAAMRERSAATPVSIHTYEDHRVAMSFGILGSHDLHGDGRAWLQIEDPTCCGKTFPEFFAVLEKLHHPA